MAKKTARKNRLSATARRTLAEDTPLDLGTPKPEPNGDGAIVSEDKAKEALIAARRAKEKACSQAIQTILTKYNCVMDVAMVVTPTQNIPQLTVRVKD